MLSIRVWATRGGRLVRVEAEGHAPGVPGRNLVCGVASAVLRSLGRWAVASDAVQVTGSAAERGSMVLDFGTASPGDGEYARGAGSLVLQTLRDLAAEADAGFRLDVIEIEEK